MTDFHRNIVLFTKLTKTSAVQISVASFTVISFSPSFFAIRSLQVVADLKFKVHDHITQVFLNGFCLFLPRHLVISVCLLAVHCGKPLVAYSHVINEKTAQYHYPATVRMSCDDGYERADGSYALRCLANGRWNDTSLRCKRKWSSGVRYHLVRFFVCLFLDKI